MVVCLSVSLVSQTMNRTLALPQDVSSQMRLSESRTSKWVRPEDIDSALQANGILVGSGT